MPARATGPASLPRPPRWYTPLSGVVSPLGGRQGRDGASRAARVLGAGAFVESLLPAEANESHMVCSGEGFDKDAALAWCRGEAVEFTRAVARISMSSCSRGGPTWMAPAWIRALWSCIAPSGPERCRLPRIGRVDHALDSGSLAGDRRRRVGAGVGRVLRWSLPGSMPLKNFSPRSHPMGLRRAPRWPRRCWARSRSD